MYVCMVHIDLCTDLYFFACLLIMSCHKNMAIYSKRIYGEMIKDRISPDVYTFTDVVGAASRQNGIPHAYDYLKQCHEQLGEIPVLVWRSLCNGVRASRLEMLSRNVVDVITDLELDEKSNTRAFNALLSRCAYFDPSLLFRSADKSFSPTTKKEFQMKVSESIR